MLKAPILFAAVLFLPAAFGQDTVPIPELKQWEKNMLEYGDKFKDQRALGIFPEVNIWFYDGQWVYFQIYDYTRDPKWLIAAQNCEETYRAHIFAENGKLPGHRMHPHGLYEDYKRNKDLKSREALLLMAKNANWVVNCKGGVKNFGCGRENGYCLMTLLLAEELGDANAGKMIDDAVDAGIFCLDEFSVTKKAEWLQPFMNGIQAEALIMYADKKNRPDRVLPALIRYADWLWEQCWVEEDLAFCYRREQPNNPATKPKKGAGAPILNSLICPMYAWLYRQTGEARFGERGDKAFVGGIKNGFLDQGKAFSQNYRWSFSYVKWRRESPRVKTQKNSGAEFNAGARKKSADAAATPASPSEPSKPDQQAASGPAATPVAAPATVPAVDAALDPATHRAALEEHLRKNVKPKKSEKVLFQSLKQEVGLAAFTDKGVTIVVQGNEMPLRWKDISNEDLIRIASVACDDGEGLYQAGALAAALKMPSLRDKFMERLGDVDPKKASELAKLR